MPEAAYWLAWTQVPGIGAVLAQRLWQHFGTLERAWLAPGDELLSVPGLGMQLVTGILSTRPTLDPQNLYYQWIAKNSHFWTPGDADYPQLLREIPDPPPLLYYAGHPQPAELTGKVPMIGVVGTREPSPYGRKWTEKLVQGLVSQGWAVVSGLAAGIDTAAHRACLQAGGRTWAVLGTGVDQVYPPGNRPLHQEIGDQGVLLSEYAAGTGPDRIHFPRRNRIIVGLCRAILITEAPLRSGALITAEFACQYNRDVYVLPGSLDNAASLGCLHLVNQGAQLILGVEHLLELLGSTPALAVALPVVPPELAGIFDLITTEPMTFDAIVTASGQPTNQVANALLELELSGHITQLPGLRYQR
ncbi:DNA protecting protein DprA [Gloeomargarita lithophora Alchichica-D10]|uniref:DNA protecting protein DprA n=1 Tax=Gloeomargarita lithophora Alchichica-D10 TaxID=1188229 RepID=A0A1J0ACP8_9CYAN|nr:DNA-processing protein DprA [Gloeomargarita lithophora]APB33709.1 DNA protecting protein DprA [Gloeomargarita lithophora Alchichica-D10]